MGQWDAVALDAKCLLPMRTSKRWWWWRRVSFLAGIWTCCVIASHAFFPPAAGGGDVRIHGLGRRLAGRNATTPEDDLDPFDYMGEWATTYRPGKQAAPNVYRNLPISRYRPLGQFVTPPEAVVSPPVITIITATYNPRHYILRSARFVLEQSLQAFKWVVVNDHSDDPVSLRRLNVLKKLAEKDWRVRVVDNTGPRGGPSAINFGLQYVDTPYVAILDDDDLWELTALEKAALVMSWIPDAYAVGFDVINHGAKEFVWTRGFHNGDENFFFENGLVQGSPMRSAVFRKCKFRNNYASGAADWDFWMCMASQGMWGLHVPENGTWYQFNPASFRQKRWKNLASANSVAITHNAIVSEYGPILNSDSAWQTVLPPALGASGEVSWGLLPFHNELAPVATRRLLLILTSLQPSSLSSEMLGYVESLARDDGWRITVMLTHFSGDEGGDEAIRSPLLQYTHDIFVAPLVSPLDNMAQLVHYLIDSRRISTVMVAHSKLGYAMLPAISAHAPDVKLIDYVETCNATVNLVARESVKMDELLDITLVPSAQAFDCVVAIGKRPEKLAVSRGTSMDLCECGEISKEEQKALREVMKIDSGVALIAVAPITDDVVASRMLEALTRAMGLEENVDRYRIYWPDAPLASVPAANSGRLASAWLPKSAASTSPGPWKLARMVLIASAAADAQPKVSAAAMSCHGAMVLVDSPTPSSSSSIWPSNDIGWDWGRGLILQAPALSGKDNIEDYARYLNLALRQLRGEAETFRPGSQGIQQKLRDGQVACTAKQALHRAHHGSARRPRAAVPSDHDLAAVAKRTAHDVQEESSRRPLHFDMRAIQQRLQYRKHRTGYGRELQRKCPERIFQNTEWIDALESITGCSGQRVDEERLRRSARDQCGAWCIADLTVSSSSLGASNDRPSGWALSGARCWSAVNSTTHPCSDHISSVLAQHHRRARGLFINVNQ